MLRGKSHTRVAISLILAGVVGAAIATAPNIASADDSPGKGSGSVVILLDSSGSMKEQSGGGKTRMEAAKIGLEKVIDAVPEDSKVGLRVYGASISDGPKSCKDTDLLVPVDTVDKVKLKAGVKKLKPLGNTPITYSLKKAAKDLPKKGSRTIVLVSDGEENCGGDPCKAARDISKTGVDLHVDVIGLQVHSKSRNQLSCIADAGGGTYYDVPDVVNLPNTIKRLSVRAARGYEPSGEPVEGGTSASDAAKITDGKWLDNIGDSGKEHYSVLDPGKGTLHLAATLRPLGLGTADASKVILSVSSADGTECGLPKTEQGVGAFTGSSPVTTTFMLSQKMKKECGEGPYTVVADAPDISGESPLSVQVLSEPGVKTADGLPAAATEEEFKVKGDPFSDSIAAVEGSTSPTNAPTIEAGTHSDTILPGEMLFYRVNLDWGQQLVCDGKLAAKPAAYKALRGSLSFVAQVNGFQGGRIQNILASQNNETWTGASETRTHATTLPVHYLNRDNSTDKLLRNSMAGGYYCAFRVTGKSDDAQKIGDLELTFNVSTVGTAGEGRPDYLEKPKSAKAADKKAGKKAAASATHSGNGIVLWVGIGVAVLIIVGIAWAYLRKMRTAR